jgi:hypothetical protein
VKRTPRAVPAKAGRAKPENRPAAPLERHSGEGSASALETLQRLETGRISARPAEPRPGDEPEGN